MLPDFYSFASSGAGTAQAKIERLSPALNHELTLYDPAKSPIAFWPPDGGVADAGRPGDAGVTLTLSATVGAGTHYLKVGAQNRESDWHGPGDPPAHLSRPYSVTVSSP